MNLPEKILDDVRTSLARFPDVTEKKMFGKIAFMVNGKLCIAAGKEDIMCRIDPLLHEATLLKKECLPVIMRGREMKGYIRIKNKDLQEEGAIKYWLELCLNYNKMIT